MRDRNTGLTFAVAIVAQILVWLLILVGAFAYGLSRWTYRTFGPITIPQALMNLAGAGGEGGGGTSIVTSGIFHSIVLPVALVALAMTVFYGVRVVARRRGRYRVLPVTVAALVVAGVAIPTAGAVAANSTFQVRDYVRSARSDLNPEAYYASPTFADTPVPDPKNLVVIYLESMEETFADDSLFGVNMLADVQDATGGWDRVPRLLNYEGGPSTITNIVATQCGLPLRFHSEQGAMNPNFWDGEDYMPGAVCLGDVLAERGYTNVFLGGASGSFASKENFLRSHGFTTVKDLEYWNEFGEGEFRADWGLSDKSLLDYARQELLALREAGRPFMLNVLTLDTHEPAYLFDYCEPSASDPMIDATRCSADLAADFIRFMEAEGFLEDTAVVVLGDHVKILAEANAFYPELSELDNRTIFNRIWSQGPQEIAVQEIDQVSMYPTILEAVGLDLIDGRAGLGVSAYQAGRPAGSIRELPAEQYEELLLANAPQFYDALWEPVAETR